VERKREREKLGKEEGDVSHRWDCPTDYEAEREGRRAGESGYKSRYSNPYTETGFQPCEEAERHWEDGFRAGERAREQQEEEERCAARAARRRAEEAAEEEYWLQWRYEQYQQQSTDGREPQLEPEK
jgi:hypothetical protein